MRKEGVMEGYPEQDTEAWLDKLDAIAAGDNVPSASDDELLQLAARLVTALAPLQEMRRAAERRHQRLPAHLRARYASARRRPVQRLRLAVLVATLLVVALIVGMLSKGGLEAIWGGATQAWHASTSFDQISVVSMATLARPHAGLKPLPLLPAALPGDTQGAAYGVITDQANPNVLVTFVADYRIAGQDVLLYEQPSYGPFSSSIAKPVRIGTMEGQLFRDGAGNNALQWYQHGMVCQITSKLAVQRLLALASLFQPIKSWDLLL
jgi:hypothetical protein